MDAWVNFNPDAGVTTWDVFMNGYISVAALVAIGFSHSVFSDEPVLKSGADYVSETKTMDADSGEEKALSISLDDAVGLANSIDAVLQADGSKVRVPVTPSYDVGLGFWVDVSANPQVVSIPAGLSLGSTTITWKWDRAQQGTMPYKYGCLYVKDPSSGVWKVVDCETKNKKWRTYIPWIGRGSSYVFRVAVQYDDTTHPDPLFITYPLTSNGSSSVVVTGE